MVTHDEDNMFLGVSRKKDAELIFCFLHVFGLHFYSVTVDVMVIYMFVGHQKKYTYIYSNALYHFGVYFVLDHW